MKANKLGHFFSIAFGDASLNRFFFLGWLSIVVMALLWGHEQSSALATVFVSCFVYFIAFFVINLFFYCGYCVNRKAWLFLFFCKVILCFFILSCFWYGPLAPRDMVRYAVQDGLTTDSNFYDYMAVEAAKVGVFSEQGLLLIQSTWLSFGVVAYGALIYNFFGISVYYIALFNCLFVLMAGLFLYAALNFNFDSSRQSFAFNLLFPVVIILPYGAYYDCLLSKEPLSLFCIYSSIFISKGIVSSSSLRFKDFIFFVFVFVFCILVRANLALLLLLVPVFFSFKRLGLIKSILVWSSVAIVFAVVASATVDVVGLFSAYTDINKVADNSELQMAVMDDGGGLKGAVADLLSPKDFAGATLLSLPRAVVWFFLPFPMLSVDLLTLFDFGMAFDSGWYEFFRVAETTLRKLSTVIILLMFPYFIRVVPIFIGGEKNKYLGARLVLYNFIVLLFVISTFMFVMGGRYRIVMEPAFYALSLYGLSGGLSRYKWLIYGFFFAVFCFYTIFSIFR